ncbi:unnamed protein product [Oppiella nova]|uniref:Cytochrome b561 domain-containing protein n=1 Tax=Oppiella nova TaxID=334625 RepID=A0A7R9QZC2_9ACAR|nr:unnamed protein product [Oppiella nova]CAG2179715.1 unnamed protein product [Oppiella nova]
MISGVVFIIIATVLIFVSVKGWSGPYAHPIVGLTSIILSVLQPIGALFRPHPDSSKRWLFNWLHWSGVAAICLATKFGNLLPKPFLGVVIAFITYIIKSDKESKLNRKTVIDILQVLLIGAIVIAFVITLIILLYR